MQASSGFSWYNGLGVKKIGHTQFIILPGNTSQLKDTVPNKLYTSPLRGHLGYHKLLALVKAHYWWLYMPLAVKEFCHQCVLYQQTKAVTQKPLGLL